MAIWDNLIAFCLTLSLLFGAHAFLDTGHVARYRLRLRMSWLLLLMAALAAGIKVWRNG